MKRIEKLNVMFTEFETVDAGKIWNKLFYRIFQEKTDMNFRY